MILSKKQWEREQRTKKNLAKIRAGDTVKLVDCAEADSNVGKTFVVLSEPWQIGGTWCVKITEKGAFDIACLEKIEV